MISATHKLLFSALLLFSGNFVARAQVSVAITDPQPGVTSTGHAWEGGLVQTWHVNIGDVVKKGDLVVSLEHVQQQHAFETAKLLAENRAPLESVMGDMKKKEAALDEGKDRFRRRQISEEQLQILEGDAEIARAQIKQTNLNIKLAHLNMDLAEKLLERRYIRSPINGTIVAISHSPGKNVGAGEAIVTVSDFSTLAVEVPLVGESLSGLETGDSLTVLTEGGGHRLARIVSMESLPGGAEGGRLVRLLFANTRPNSPESYQLLLPKGLQGAPPAKSPEKS
jgi:multidrug efflux pump subunit AcrA (membrane-fusion protein)